ncbi:MAG: hypothetical protein KDD39_06475 [Bdellovibrionales bacterium]|nr:hypothetical protein [Bdellovibrionales bacterium]
MRSLILALLIAFSCLTPTKVWADDEDSESNSQFPTGLVYGLHVGVNLVSGFIGGGATSANRIGFQGGLDGKYYFAPKCGCSDGVAVCEPWYWNEQRVLPRYSFCHLVSLRRADG